MNVTGYRVVLCLRVCLFVYLRGRPALFVSHKHGGLCYDKLWLGYSEHKRENSAYSSFSLSIAQRFFNSGQMESDPGVGHTDPTVCPMWAKISTRVNVATSPVSGDQTNSNKESQETAGG